MNLFDWPDRRAAPLQIPWSTERMVNDVIEFREPTEWLDFLRARDLHPAVPAVVNLKFQRAQKLYALAWLESDVIKAGELVALTALEMALRDQYGSLVRDLRITKFGRGKQIPMLEALLRYCVDHDGLTAARLPSRQKYHQEELSFLFEAGDSRKAREAQNARDGTDIAPPTTLVGIRNRMAHGDPFDGMIWAGLLDLVRDLIEYVYRDRITEAANGGSA